MKKHVLLTGASSGIGEALFQTFSAAGYQLSIVARRKEKLEALAEASSGATKVIGADLSNPEEVLSAHRQAVDSFGPVDILINNAGIQYVEPLTATQVGGGEKLIQLNLLTPLQLSRLVLPDMIASGEGYIVDIASLAAIAPTPFMAYYNASKAGLAAASESLHGELRATGVKMLTVYPGPVDTPMARSAYKALEDVQTAKTLPEGTTDVLAQLILNKVQRHRGGRIIYPRIYWVARWFPGTTRWFLDKFGPKLEPGQTISASA